MEKWYEREWQRMEVRVYPTLAAHDRDDPAFWLARPAAQRVAQAWALSEAQYSALW